MADGLRLGLYGLHWGTDPEVLVRRARRAEEAGFESLWVGDHIALPVTYGDAERLEAVVAVTYLAAATTRIRLGFGLIVLPQRQPVLLAKQLSSVDVLAGGRLTVGVGVGYVEPELRALGVPLERRGERTDEYLAAMQALWAGVDSFDGEFVSYHDVQQRPQPAQRPHPPIVVGGHSAAAYRRAARHASGWYGWDLDVEQAAESIATLHAAADREQRPAGLGDLEIMITPPGPVDVDTARRYAEVGVHRLILQPHPAAEAGLDDLIARTADTLIGHI
jgi:probable F420-dependent oxidoreductase